MGKLDAHKRGLRHKAVSVFINCGDATLLQQRALFKYHSPGLWANACCTHPFWEENPADCAVRRLEEELNVMDAAPDYRGHVHYRADVGSDLIEDEEVDVFVVEAPLRISVTPNPNEVMGVRWVRFSDLADEIGAHGSQFTPWLRIYLSKHSEMIRA